MAKIGANGIVLYYELRGQGFPLVMLMGLSANADWWPARLIDDLARSYRLVLLDNRGAGRSEAPAGEYSIPLFAADTVALMAALGLPRAHVFGLSMGGMIAQEMALQYPERVEKLVLGCTNCGLSHSIPAEAAVIGILLKRDYQTVDEFLGRIIPILFPKDYGEAHPELMEELKEKYRIAPIRPEAYNRQLEAVIGFDSFDRLDRIQAPTLVLTGDRDVLVPPENSAILARRIKGAKLVIVPGGGHSFITQEPELVSRALRDFLG